MPLHPLIVLANYHQFASADRFVASCVESRMFLFCDNGLGRVCANGTWFDVKAGDFFILPWQHSLIYEANPRKPFLVGGIHIIPDAKAQENLQFYQVAHNRKSEFFSKSFRSDAVIDGLSQLITGKLSSNKGLYHLSQYIIEFFIRNTPQEAPLRQLALQLIEEWVYVAKGQTKINLFTNRSLETMMFYIEKNINHSIELDDLAKIANISTSTVIRLFKQNLKLTPIQYINQQRMQIAQRLLSSSNTPINQIADKVGVPDVFYFSKLFKTYTSESPLAYRKNYSILHHAKK